MRLFCELIFYAKTKIIYMFAPAKIKINDEKENQLSFYTHNGIIYNLLQRQN